MIDDKPMQFQEGILQLFPGNSKAADTLKVRIGRNADGLQLHYTLSGNLDSLRLPPPVATPAFTNDLWQHSCFEIFVARPGEAAYREFDFSPSGNWAAYAFSAYREREAWNVASAPRILAQCEADDFLLQVDLPAVLLPTGPLEAGIASVLETTDGGLSYWALRHTGAKPDFHRRDSFILTIPGDPT